jgi:hypothetical protein
VASFSFIVTLSKGPADTSVGITTQFHTIAPPLAMPALATILYTVNSVTDFVNDRFDTIVKAG